MFEAARTRLLYGARLRRARQRVRSREQLRRALDDFGRLGAAPWCDAADAELAATGETARRRDPTTRDDLTPRELQIAVLLAEGSTTRQAVCQRLAPRASEAAVRLRGTLEMASSAMVKMIGITAKPRAMAMMMLLSR